MLQKIDKKGHVFSVSEVPFEDEYRVLRLKIPHLSMQRIIDYLENDIENDDSGFSVGTRYPNNHPAWEEPFNAIYEAMGKDTVMTGYLLGSIVMDIIIHRPEKWFCTKTDVTKRDFEINFYFRPGY